MSQLLSGEAVASRSVLDAECCECPPELRPGNASSAASDYLIAAIAWLRKKRPSKDLKMIQVLTRTDGTISMDSRVRSAKACGNT